ncbi:UNVERIFIED_CONTAM: hypothetical protein FKN15_058060 [Acipenser sinensis]
MLISGDGGGQDLCSYLTVAEAEAAPAPLLLEVEEAEAALAPLLLAVVEAEAAPAPLLLVEKVVEVAEAEAAPLPLLLAVEGTVVEAVAMGLMLATQREAVAVLAPSAVAAGLVCAALPSAA